IRTFWSDSAGPTGYHGEFGSDNNTAPYPGEEIHSASIQMGTGIPSSWIPGVSLAELFQGSLGARADPPVDTESILVPLYVYNNSVFSQLDLKGIKIMENRALGNAAVTEGGILIRDYNPK
ncbi:hypothetical protein ISS05_03480, partial [Candidatus Woesearchaeota archaeon]|nr:hypothetical protein [Candidatus Woesearchaeota archaeon]